MVYGLSLLATLVFLLLRGYLFAKVSKTLILFISAYDLSYIILLKIASITCKIHDIKIHDNYTSQKVCFMMSKNRQDIKNINFDF